LETLCPCSLAGVILLQRDAEATQRFAEAQIATIHVGGSNQKVEQEQGNLCRFFGIHELYVDRAVPDRGGNPHRASIVGREDNVRQVEAVIVLDLDPVAQVQRLNTAVKITQLLVDVNGKEV